MAASLSIGRFRMYDRRNLYGGTTIITYWGAGDMEDMVNWTGTPNV